ncbi:MAG: DUF6496 domain-containing protein [Nitrospinota bacterium]
MPSHTKAERKRKAMAHPDRPGAGAAARRKHLKNPGEKIATVMSEFKRGTLRSGSGEKVKKRSQAVAIGLSEERAAGARIPKPRPKGSGEFTEQEIAQGFRKLG